MELHFHILIAFGLSAISGQQNHIRRDHDFDVLVFTQRWPQTACYKWQEKNPSHTCNLPDNGGWTVHGIWPTKFTNIGPFFCEEGWHLDPELIRPIQADLEQKWTNIWRGTPKFELWDHEWRKHGTCSAVLPQLSDETKYFAQGLTWRDQYSMTEAFNNAGIYPAVDTEYEFEDVYNAIEMYLGKKPSINCKVEARYNLIAEIKICFDKNLDLQNCDGIAYHSNCDIHKRILYPDAVPTKH